MGNTFGLGGSGGGPPFGVAIDAELFDKSDELLPAVSELLLLLAADVMVEPNATEESFSLDISQLSGKTAEWRRIGIGCVSSAVS